MHDNDDASSVVAGLAATLLGNATTLTSRDVAKLTGVSVEETAARWRTLGHPAVAAGAVAFTKSDVEALEAVERLFRRYPVDQSTEDAFLRTIGRTFSRLAEWEVRAILQSIKELDVGHLTGDQVREVGEVLALSSKVHENVWRRHVAAAATRLVLHDATTDDTDVACAGFVDIVGFTTRSRSMTGQDLTVLVERFESVVSDLIFEHGGRVVKTIGDEILFVVDDPVDAAWLGVELVDQHRHDAAFPEVRVGMAYGEVFNRLGDVLGPVVNLASRLTSAAPRGRVVIDPQMAEQVVDTSGLRLRQMRRLYVKGFDHVEPWSLKLDRQDRRSGLRGALDEILEDAAEGITRRLPLLD